MEAHNPMFQDIWPQNNTLRLYPQQVSLQQLGTRHLDASVMQPNSGFAGSRVASTCKEAHTHDC
jgi:hypothetical protein